MLNLGHGVAHRGVSFFSPSKVFKWAKNEGVFSSEKGASENTRCTLVVVWKILSEIGNRYDNNLQFVVVEMIRRYSSYSLAEQRNSKYTSNEASHILTIVVIQYTR